MTPSQNNKTENIAYLGIFTALCIVISYIERLIPPPIPIPGIKLGLSNVVVLIVMYNYGSKPSFFISVVRILTVALLFSGISGLIYSLSGGLLSFFTMVFLKRMKIFSVCGVSIAGGVFHNLGQILAACLIMENIYLLYFFPALIISGMIMGFITGAAAHVTLNHLKRLKFNK